MSLIKVDYGDIGEGVSYLETATGIGWSGNMFSCIADLENGSAKSGATAALNGNYLSVGYSSTTLQITVLSTVVGSIDVDYCSFDANNQPVYSSGTFSAGDTVITKSFSGSAKAGVWAAVKK